MALCVELALEEAPDRL